LLREDGQHVQFVGNADVAFMLQAIGFTAGDRVG
jgi:hypothetical protein